MQLDAESWMAGLFAILLEYRGRGLKESRYLFSARSIVRVVVLYDATCHCCQNRATNLEMFHGSTKQTLHVLRGHSAIGDYSRATIPTRRILGQEAEAEGWSEAHREDGLKYSPRALKIASGHPAGPGSPRKREAS